MKKKSEGRKSSNSRKQKIRNIFRIPIQDSSVSLPKKYISLTKTLKKTPENGAELTFLIP